jgi:hypothetical protein
VLAVGLVVGVVAIAAVPDLRWRVEKRWLLHELQSPDATTREATSQKLLARGRPEIDEVFPEIVAAAVINVESASRFVAIGASDRHPGPGVVRIFLEQLGHYNGPYLHVERCLVGSVPRELEGWDEPARPLFEVSEERSLFVGGRRSVGSERYRLVLVVPLRGELGSRIIAEVEARLRQGE